MGPGRYGPVTFRSHAALNGDGDRVKDGSHHSSTKEPQLQAMRWGLIPSFTKPHAKPDHFIMFNARSENLHERPAFRRLLETKRCVVLADGYYEWQQLDKREKQPYYVYKTSSDSLKFAGLYDSWVNEAGETMYSYTILTTSIAPEMAWMHTRMPVLLSDEGAQRWLSDAKFNTLRDLLVSYRGGDLKWHPVDKKVGSTKFQSEDCSKKVDIKHAGDIKSFFGGGGLKNPTTTSSPTKALANVGKATTIDELPSSSLKLPDKNVGTSQVTSPQPAITSQWSKLHQPTTSPIKSLFQEQQQLQEFLDATRPEDSKTSFAALKTSGFVTASSLPSEVSTKRALPSSPNLQTNLSPKRQKPNPRTKSTSKPPKGSILAFFQPTD